MQVVSAGSFNICIAGTHGKTTISTMIAHLLRHSGYGCNAFLGGIAANYGTNVLLNDDAQLNVVEADEYDRSFLKLCPAQSIITAMDPDHLDIYGTPEAMFEAYTQFAVQCDGPLLVQNDGRSHHRTSDGTTADFIHSDQQRSSGPRIVLAHERRAGRRTARAGQFSRFSRMRAALPLSLRR